MGNTRFSTDDGLGFLGLLQMRRDWKHYCRVAGAEGFFPSLGVLLSSPSLWALWIFRYGRWAYGLRNRVISAPFRAWYLFIYHIGQHVAKVAIDIIADVEADVWIAPRGSAHVAPGSRVGSGSFLHGDNTLGSGGRPGNRGVPRIGRNCHVAPGAVLVGPVEVPDETILGANAVVVRSLPHGGAWVGCPARPYEGTASDLIPYRGRRKAGRTA